MVTAAFWLVAASALGAGAVEPIDIGTRLELFVDDYLIDSMSGGAELRLHHPEPREIVLRHDAPWEGSGCNYHAVFQDGDVFRMYYDAWHLDVQPGALNTPHDTIGAYAESKDGIHWEKPNLGLFEFNGSKENNIIWVGPGSHDFTPFKDTNPDCLPGEEYKAVGYNDKPPHGLYAFKSSDAIHWDFIQPEAVMTGYPFDTQNLAFWDSVTGEYRAYIRDFNNGIRGIRMATSKDFRTWTPAEWLVYPGAADEQLYTNQIKPYYRAPHIYIGFPVRYVERGWSPSMEALPNPEHRHMRSSSVDRYGTAITETLLMSSRDGLTFHRWPEAFMRPGLRTTETWAYGDLYTAWHVIETPSAIEDAPNELSLFSTESYWTGTDTNLRRYTLRIDGFASLNAPMEGGEFVTKPIVFQGNKLVLNFATSAAGSIRIEVQDADGTPIECFALADAPEIFGDSLDRVAPWKDGRSIGELAGTPVRLRFVMNDADLYSMKFEE